MHPFRRAISARHTFTYPGLLLKTLILSLILTTRAQVSPTPPGNPTVSPHPSPASPPPSPPRCPNLCPAHYDPICGSDGKTYSNHCYLTARNCGDFSPVRIKHAGECDKTHQEATKRDFNLVLGGTAAFTIVIIIVIFASVSALRRRHRHSPRNPNTSVQMVPGMLASNAPICMYQRSSRRLHQPPALGFVVSPPKYEDIVRCSSGRTRENSSLPPSYESVTRVSQDADATDT